MSILPVLFPQGPLVPAVNVTSVRARGEDASQLGLGLQLPLGPAGNHKNHVPS